jgi:hypothetical protein
MRDDVKDPFPTMECGRCGIVEKMTPCEKNIVLTGFDIPKNWEMCWDDRGWPIWCCFDCANPE